MERRWNNRLGWQRWRWRTLGFGRLFGLGWLCGLGRFFGLGR